MAQGRRNTPRRGEQGRGARDSRPAPKAADNSATLYMVIAAVGLVALLGVAMAMSGGDGKKKKDMDSELSRLLTQAVQARNSGNPQQALSILEGIVADKRFRSCDRYAECETQAAALRTELDSENQGRIKVADFKARVEKAKEQRIAMSKANEFWAECEALLQRFGTTTSGAELRNIKEDLRRWVDTAAQGNWQKDYNQVKDRAKRDCLSQGNFRGAVRIWQEFRETSQDSLLHARITQELLDIDNAAVKAAEALIAGGASNTDLENALPRFMETKGQDVINKKLKGAK